MEKPGELKKGVPLSKKGVLTLMSATMAATPVIVNIPEVAQAENLPGSENVEEVDSADAAVNISVDQDYDVDVVLSVGSSDQDVSSFEADLRQKLRSGGIPLDSIKITAVEATEVDAKNNFSWQVYEHANYLDPNIKNRDGSPKYPNHIEVDGQDINMHGYGDKGFKDFMFMSDSMATKKTFDFTINENTVSSHTLEGAGFLFNTKKWTDTNGREKMSGYLVLVSYLFNEMQLYQFENIDVKNFSDFTTGQQIYNYTGFSKIATAPKSNDSTKLIKIEASPSKVKMWVNGNALTWTKVVDSSNHTEFPLDKNYSEYGFGPLAAYQSHYCSIETHFTYKNIVMSTEVVKRFLEVLRQPEWRKTAKSFIVNLDDTTVSDFENPVAMGEILSRMDNDDIHYIGWGNDDPNKADDETSEQASSFISKNNGRGTFVNRLNSTTEQDINAIAQYIANEYQKSQKSNVEYIPDGTNYQLNVTPPEKAINTADGDWPNGKWRVEHDPLAFVNNEGEVSYNHQYLNNMDVHFNKPGKYEIYYQDVLVKTIYVHRKPISSFTISKDFNNNLTFGDESYDPDHQSEPNKGIVERQWRYKKTSDIGWTVGQPTTLGENENYIIQLMVKDQEGAWSTSYSQYTSTSINVKPIAEFTLSQTTQYKHVGTVEVNDLSYDPFGKSIASRTWTVKKGTTSINVPIVNGKMDFSNQSAGNYTISLIVENADGVKSEAFSRVLTIIDDQTAPTVTADISEGEFNLPKSIGLTFNDTGDSGLNYQQFVVNGDTTPPTEWGAPGYNNVRTVQFNEAGTWYIHYKAVDHAGNTKIGYFGPYEITDTSTPTKPIISMKTAEDGKDYITGTPTTQDVQITFSGSTDNSGFVIYEYSYDGENWESSANTTITAEGKTTLYYRAKDRTGNLSDVGSVVVEIDRTQPKIDSVNITTDNNIQKGFVKPGDTVTVTFESDENLLPPTVVIQGESATVTKKGDEPEQWEATYKLTGSEQEGTVTYSITYQDLAGNAGEVKSGTINDIKFDGNAPNVTLTSAVTDKTNGLVTIVVEASDALSGIDVKKWGVVQEGEEEEKGELTADYFKEGGTPFTEVFLNVRKKGTYYVYVRDVAGNETVKEINISNIDKDLPGITLEASTTDPTNERVTVKVSYTKEDQIAVQKWDEGIHDPAYFISKGQRLENKEIPGLTNGTYTVYVKDSAGNESVSYITIDNFDDTLPSINLHADNRWTNGRVVITADITDNKSGIKVKKWAKDVKDSNYFTGSGGTEFTQNTFAVEEPGTYTVYAEDKAGNKTINFVTVYSIEQTAPTLETSISPETRTNGKVTVTVNVYDENGGSGIGVVKWAKDDRPASYFEQYGQPLTGSSFVVTENGDYTIFAKDNAGNIALKTITINNIETNAPVIRLNQPENWTSGSVTVTALITDNNNDIKAIKWAKGEKKVSDFDQGNNGSDLTDSQFEATENGIYTVYAIDKSGNETVNTITVNWIDRTPPVVRAYKSSENPTNHLITIGVEATDSGSGVKVKKWANGIITDPAEFVGTQFSGILFDVNQSGDYTIYVEDNVGNITLETIHVSNVDHNTPTITLDAEDTPTNENVTINVSIDKNPVPIKQWAYGTHTKEDFRERNVGEDINGTTFEADQNGTYTVYVMDEAGNEAVQTIYVSNIDREAPAVENPVVNVSNPYEIQLSFNDNVEVSTADGFIVNVNGQDILIKTAVSDGNTITLTLDQPISYGQSVTVSYTQENGNVVDKAGNPLDSFVGRSVTNEVGRTNEEQQLANAEKAVQKAELFKSMVYVERAQELLNQLSDSDQKLQLQDRLDAAREAAENFEESPNKLTFDSNQVADYMALAEGLIHDLPDEESNKNAILERFQLLKEELEQFKDEDTGKYEISLERAQQYVDDNKGFIDSLDDNNDLKTIIQVLSQKVQGKIDSAVQKRNQIQEAIAAVERAEGSKSEGDIAVARELVSKLDEGEQKTSLLERIDQVQRDVDEERNSNQAKADAIRDAILAISQLPSTQDLAYSDRELVQSVRDQVNAAKRLGATDADITNLATLIACENKISDLSSKKPTIDISVTPNYGDGSATISFGVNDRGSRIVEKKWLEGSRSVHDFGTGGAAIDGNSFNVYQEGTYTLYIRDEAGNEVVKTFVVKNKPYQLTGQLTSQGGLKATATIKVADNANPISGTKYVVFQLMKGTTPISVVAIEKGLQTTDNVSAFFNVTGSNYSVIVNVLDKELDNQSEVGRSLAEPMTLTIRR